MANTSKNHLLSCHKWREKNKEYDKERCRKYYHNHRKVQLEKAKKYYQKHLERQRKLARIRGKKRYWKNKCRIIKVKLK